MATLTCFFFRSFVRSLASAFNCCCCCCFFRFFKSSSFIAIFFLFSFAVAIFYSFHFHCEQVNIHNSFYCSNIFHISERSWSETTGWEFMLHAIIIADVVGCQNVFMLMFFSRFFLFFRSINIYVIYSSKCTPNLVAFLASKLVFILFNYFD